MVLREVITRLGYDVDEGNLKKYNSQLKAISKNAKDYGRQMQMMGAKFAIGLSVPIALMSKKMVKAGSDAQETHSKYSVVFSGIRDESSKTAQSLSRDFGIAQSSAEKFIGDTGDVLTGFGFSQKEALKISNRVQRLALDLDSLQNLEGGAKQASDSLTRGLLGERESMKTLGIAILEKDVKARIALMTSKGQTFQTERQAKAVATLQIAVEQSKNAIGDVSRTWNDYANVERRWGESRKKMWEEYGAILLPIAKKILIFSTSMIDKMTNLSDGWKKFILVLGGFLFVIGPILLALGTMLTIFGSLAGFLSGTSGIIAGLKMLGVVAKGTLLPFLTIFAVVGFIFILIQEITAWINGDASLIGKFLDIEEYKKDWSDLMNFFADSGKNTGEQWGIFFLEGITGTMGAFLNWLLIDPLKEVAKLLPKKSSSNSSVGIIQKIKKSLMPEEDYKSGKKPQLLSSRELLQKALRHQRSFNGYTNIPAVEEKGNKGGFDLLAKALKSVNSKSVKGGDVNIYVDGVGDSTKVANELYGIIVRETDQLAVSEKNGVATDTPLQVNQESTYPKLPKGSGGF